MNNKNATYVTVRHLNKKIGKTQILRDVSLDVPTNNIVGLQGINGSGKTMLLRAIAGLINFEGKIEIGGIDITKKEYEHDIGILIEHPGFLNEFTAVENLELLSLLQEKASEADIVQAIKRVGLDPEDKRKYRKFSLGMKQRLGIAQAILGEPKLILLDEPTNGIDENGVGLLKELMHTLKTKGCTIIIASHDKEFLNDVAEKINVIEGGALR